MSARFRWFDALLLSAAALFSVAVIAAATMAPKHDGAGVAVIFAPWTSAQDSLSRAVGAGGRFVRFGAFDFIAVVEPDVENYPQSVRANGAWFVADPLALAACMKLFKASRS